MIIKKFPLHGNLEFLPPSMKNPKKFNQKILKNVKEFKILFFFDFDYNIWDWCIN